MKESSKRIVDAKPIAQSKAADAVKDGNVRVDKTGHFQPKNKQESKSGRR